MDAKKKKAYSARLPGGIGGEKTTIKKVVMFRRIPALVVGVVSALPFAAQAQTPSSTITGNAAPTGPATSAFSTDIIHVNNAGPGIPLKHGAVVPQSEVVYLDGTPLARGADYQVDCVAGVLYLLRQQKAGQIVRVTYRYEPSKLSLNLDRHVAGVSNSFQLLAMNNTRLGMDFDRGYTYGGKLDGSDRIIGGSSALSIGGIQATGAYLMGTMPIASTTADGRQVPIKTTNQFIVQKLQTSVAGGTAQIDYQDISTDFGSYSEVNKLGFAEDQVKQFQREAGLKRLGVSLNDLKLGHTKFSSAFKSVNDNGHVIDWKSVNVASGGFSLDWNSRRVSSGFSRFEDLTEKDKDQLMAETGLSRDSLTAAYKSKLTSLSFTSTGISDEAGKSIRKREINFAIPNAKLNLGDQKVDGAFTRLDSLFDPEKGQWGRELGIQRQWASLEATILGKDSQPLKFAYDDLRGASGFSKSVSGSVGTKTWNLQYFDHKASPGFGNLGSMRDDEADDHIKRIANLYQPGMATDPSQRGSFMSLAGVERTGVAFTAKPFKDWDVSLSTANLKDPSDKAFFNNLALSNRLLDFKYTQSHTGVKFGELFQLMPFEQSRLSTVPGIDRSDFAINFKLPPGRTLNAEQTVIESAAGNAKRQSLNFTNSKIEVHVATRSVDPGFTAIAGLANEPDNALLAIIRGHSELDANVKWQMLPTLKFEGHTQSVDALVGDSFGTFNDAMLMWNPDKRTELSIVHQEVRSKDPLQQLFKSIFTRFDFKRDFGKYGVLELTHIDRDRQGVSLNPALTMATAAVPPPQPGAVDGRSSTDYVSYTANVGANTSLKTEESRTKYSNGQDETYSANTVSTNLTKNLGVSYTDLRIDRPGTTLDQTKKNYGFWLNIGHGLKFSYGYARDLSGPNGTMQSSMGISSGIWGPFRVNNASYAENRWDQQHTQALSNIQIESSKPLRLGFLKDVQFKYGLDAASDYTTWVRENRLFGVSGKIGSNTLAYENKSQIDATGNRGRDRFFMFETDQSDKRHLKASVKYKIRELPNQSPIMIRDISVTARPVKNLEITNQLLTNPENQVRPDLLLGTLTDSWRINRWKLDYHSGTNTVIGGSYEDRINDATKEMTRIGGINVELFKNSGSPLSFFYGMEQAGGSLPHQLAQRYWVRFDQKPGPNQRLSLFAGNVSYDHTIANGFSANNWTVHAEYQLRFWSRRASKK